MNRRGRQIPIFIRCFRSALRKSRGVIVGTTMGLAFLGSQEATASVNLSAPSAREQPKELSESVSKSETPFWRRSPDRLLQIREGRSIQVSSKREDFKSGEMRFVFHGAGDVSRSCQFTLQTAQQFERLPEISEHFKGVVSDADRGQVFLIAQALGFKSKLMLQFDVMSPANEKNQNLKFEVIWGAFKGLTGELLFDPLDDGKCEVSVVATFQTTDPPLPKRVLGFALEVVIQKVAEKMRAYAEHAKAIDLTTSANDESENKIQAGQDRLREVMLREKIPISLLRPIRIGPVPTAHQQK